ncbi:MAG: helix-turn-helix domain-containing protein [Rhizobiales bacterium]|nr:helix-turn-helix domain-containing protein [Hyphomicrobiales bacterium]
MPIDPARLETIRHASDIGRWELIRCRPDARLAPYVSDYQGYREWGSATVRRVEFALPIVPVIINFGPAWSLGDGHKPGRMMRHGSFVAGMYSTYAISENTGASHCLQFNLTPIGAREIFGIPMHELSERIVDFSDVMGRAGAELETQIAEAVDWQTRFDILERFLIGRVADAQSVSGAVRHAWTRLSDTGGMIPVAALADELQWSRKHLASKFRQDIGLAPKTIARLLRFRRVVDRQTTDLSSRWAEVALDAGYFDQAHLIRDFRQFAGMTPVEFRRSRLADGSGVIDNVPRG